MGGFPSHKMNNQPGTEELRVNQQSLKIVKDILGKINAFNELNICFLMNRCKFPPLLTANNCYIRCSYKFILHHPVSLFCSLESKIRYHGVCCWLEAFTTLASGSVFWFLNLSFSPIDFVCFMVQTSSNLFGWCGKPIVTYTCQLITDLIFFPMLACKWMPFWESHLASPRSLESTLLLSGIKKPLPILCP